MAKRKAKSKESNVVITKRPAEKLQTQTRKNVRCPKCKTGDVRNKGRLGSTVYYVCNRCFKGEKQMGTSTTFQVFFDRDLSTAFSPGEWEDERVLIVGPHPRAMDYDAKEIKGKPTMAVGSAWMLFAKYSLIPDVFYSANMRFVDRVRDNEEFKTWTNFKASPSVLSNSIPNNWLTIKATKASFSDRLSDGVFTGHQLVTAVCIAASLGARKFDLVGFNLDGHDIQVGHSPEAQEFDLEASMVLSDIAKRHGLSFNFIG